MSKPLGPQVTPVRVRNASSRYIPSGRYIPSAASTSAPASVQQINSVHAPGEVFVKPEQTGLHSGVVAGILAGSYIAFGALLSVSLGGTIPGQSIRVPQRQDFTPCTFADPSAA
eukprot:scaffold284785_cov15-Tisochrysis_lutea.AAC.1